MGMTYTSFGAPVTTKNLQANADLNLGSYDLICTDAKGDTAEFAEFVGGVGNFSNVLGSGNLDIEGTASIKGNTQIDGNLVLEGAINNVNIADNGEITTSQGVNGADFNGAIITSTKFNGATINSSGDYSGRKGTFSGAVSGTTGTFSGEVTATGLITANGGIKGSLTGNATTATNLSRTVTVSYTGSTLSAQQAYFIPFLPYAPGVLYTGKLKARSESEGYPLKLYKLSSSNSWSNTTVAAGTDTEYTFSNIKCLLLTCSSSWRIALPTFT